MAPAPPLRSRGVLVTIARLFGEPKNPKPKPQTIIRQTMSAACGCAGAIQSTARLLGQTVGSALVALIFGFAGPSSGTGLTVAILLAAGFAAIAAVLSVLRMSRFVRFPGSPRRAGPAAADEQERQAAAK
jgi:hypothetical protein